MRREWALTSMLTSGSIGYADIRARASRARQSGRGPAAAEASRSWRRRPASLIGGRCLGEPGGA